MFCPNCGASLPEGARFCGMCGKPVPEAVTNAEAPAPETTIPVITEDTTPVAEPVQTMEQPVAEPVQTAEIKSDPLDFTPLVAAPIEPPKKKKSKKGLVIGLSAAAAVIVAGGAVGYFGFHDDITRLIMGDAGYSKMIEEHSYSDYIGIKNIGEEKLNKALSERIGTVATINNGNILSSNFNDIGSIGILLSKNKEDLSKALNGNNAISFDASGEYHISDELLEYISKSEGEDVSFKDYIELFNSLKFSGSVTAGDISEASFNISGEGGSFLTYDIITDKDGNAVFSLPELTDKYYRSEKKEQKEQAEEEAKIPTTFDETQMKRIKENLSELYYKYFEKGSITVTKDYELKNGNTVIKGTAIISEFDSNLLNNFFTEVNDYLYNDQYVKGYCTGTLSMTAEEYKKLFTSEKVNGKYKVINLVDKHNNVIGKRIELTDDDTEEKVEIEYLKEDKEQVFLFANSEFKVVVRNTMTDERNGKVNVKLMTQKNESFLSAQALSLDVIYSDLEKAEIFGQEVNTGSVTVKIADDDMFIKGTLGMLYGFSSIMDKSKSDSDVSDEMMSLQQDNTKNNYTALMKSLIEALSKTEINVTLKKEGEGVNMQYSLSLGEMLSIKTNATATALMKNPEMPDESKIVDIESDDNGTELEKALLERVKEFAVKDKHFEKIVNVNDINDKINKIEKDNNFKKNYSEYSEYVSKIKANNNAINIYDRINNSLADLLAENGAESGGVIKLYFDKDGNVTVIDSAGFDKTDFSTILKDYARSSYVEITLDWKHIAGLGVTAVLTDDMNNIPEKFPKWYNYQDKVYDWEDEEGYIGCFVAGTYPKLYEGTSTAEGDYINLDKDIAALEGYAKTVGRFTENYLKSRDYTITTANDYVSLVLERNTAGWQAVTAYRGIWEYNVGEVFDESFVALYLDALNTNSTVSAISDDVRIELFFDNIDDDTVKKPWFVGVGVNYVKDNDKLVQYGKPQCEDYINGYYSWTGKKYLWADAESGYYLGAGGIVLPFGTYSATTGDALIPNNLYPADYILGQDIVSTYNYSQADPFGINGVWTLITIDGTSITQYAKDNGYKISELQKNLIIYDDVIEVEDINGINDYPISYDSYGFRLHYDEVRFADFTVDTEDHSLSYKDLINGRDIVTYKFIEGYSIIEKPELQQGSFDIASLAGTWVLTKIGGVSAEEQSEGGVSYTIEIGSDGSVTVCGETGYVTIPTDTGFKLYIESINYPIWDLNYDLNTDTLTDSTNGENEIYLFERSQ